MPNKGANPDDRFPVNMEHKFLIHKDYSIFYTVEEANKEKQIKFSQPKPLFN